MARLCQDASHSILTRVHEHSVAIGRDGNSDCLPVVEALAEQDEGPGQQLGAVGRNWVTARDVNCNRYAVIREVNPLGIGLVEQLRCL